ncbi:MAG: LacI family DNA-binding transcriptional regulator, partial [Pseudomonadota bacterium]
RGRARPNRRPRMEDVARLANVSPMTVSRALRYDSPVAEETRKRILKVIDEIGYVPDQIASGLSSQRSGFVAICLPSLNNSHFADTLSALNRRIAEHDLQVLIGHTDYRSDKEEKVVEAMLRRRPEAIVLTYDGHTPRTRALLQASGIPIIEIWEQPKDPLDHVVGFSNHAASYAITSRLIEDGYTRLAFLGEATDDGSRGAARREGFLQAVREAGLDDTRLLYAARAPITMSDGARAVAGLRETWPDTDAVFAVSDPCAFGMISECLRLGISVPDDLAIAGFGDFEIGRLSLPGLTTVGVDADAIGRKTGDLIIELRNAARAGDIIAAQHVDVPISILKRGSS